MAETDRRNVLQGLAAGAASMTLTQSALAAQADRPYRVGVVGSGWFGKLNLYALMQVAPAEAVALCDVDRRMLTEARDLTMARRDSVAPPRRRPACGGRVAQSVRRV